LEEGCWRASLLLCGEMMDVANRLIVGVWDGQKAMGVAGGVRVESDDVSLSLLPLSVVEDMIPDTFGIDHIDSVEQTFLTESFRQISRMSLRRAQLPRPGSDRNDRCPTEPIDKKTRRNCCLGTCANARA
jgi:hypothetical protein